MRTSRRNACYAILLLLFLAYGGIADACEARVTCGFDSRGLSIPAISCTGNVICETGGMSVDCISLEWYGMIPIPTETFKVCGDGSGERAPEHVEP
jgi:hypothetical protein